MTAPWKSRLVLKLFLSYLGIVFLLSVFFYLYSGTVIRGFYISSLSKKMQEEAGLAGRLLPTGRSGDAMDEVCRQLGRELGARITVVAADGKVLGDSDEASVKMENHAGRPEVLEAFANGTGRSVRYSTTVSHEMLYQAVLQRAGTDQRVIRLSVPLSQVQEVLGSIRRTILIGLILAAALGLLSALAFSRTLSLRVRRMVEFSQNVAQGSFPQESLVARGEDELSLLEKNLNEMSRRIREKVRETVAEKEKAESILKCMIEGVLVVDTRGSLILINDNAREMFQLPPARDLHGVSLSEISRHPEMKRLLAEVLACDCSAQCFSSEIGLDEGRWFRVNAVSLKAADEKALGYILVFHDVTELKRLETVRADFVANVSHELRTPLTAIRGYTETLLQSPPPDPKDAEHFLGIIYRHSERLGRLIDDLLALSDLESGKIRVAAQKLQAGELIGRVLEIFQEQARKKELQLSQKVQSGLPPILGDSDRLQQLLINLIDNALKYTPIGGRVLVSASLVSPGNHHPSMVEIAVADTGSGIPEKDLPRLTERFYRVDKARSQELGGTGLGLAIVKHIVQAHHGQLKIESRIQKGTTVRVSLPAENGEKS